MTRGRTRYRRHPGDRGAAAVEFALVLTVLLLIIFGIIDFGRLLFASQSMKAASREGARAAAVQSQVAAIESAVASSGAAGASLAGGTLTTTIVSRNAGGSVINPTPTPPCGGAAENVEVTATTDFDWFTPTGIFAGSIDQVSSSTTMRCE